MKVNDNSPNDQNPGSAMPIGSSFFSQTDSRFPSAGSPGPLPARPYYQPSTFGSIRNTLGSGLKNSGVFQKDGHIQNLRGGFIGPKNSGYSDYLANPSQRPHGMPGLGEENRGTLLGAAEMPRQRELILQAAHEGIRGNGVATISPEHTFLLVANLPVPQTFIQGMEWSGPAVYASYLVDKKGKTGFMAGMMTPVGNGVYRSYFQSTVPLTPYEKVVVSVENPLQLGQHPYGPIVLMVKDGPGPILFLRQMKGMAIFAGGKISGLFHRLVKPSPVKEGISGSVLSDEGLSAGVTPEGIMPGGTPTGVFPTGEINAAGSAILPAQPLNSNNYSIPQQPVGGNPQR